MKKIIILGSLLLGGFLLSAQTLDTAQPAAITADTLTPSGVQEKFNYYFQEALRLKADSRYAEAFELFNYCLSLDSTDAAVYSELATFYQGLGQEAKAIEYYQKAQALDNNNEWFILQLASVYKSKGEYSKAIALLDKLVKQNPDKYELHYHMADLYLELKNYTAAIEELNLFENSVGKKEELSQQKYDIYMQMGKPKKATQEIASLYKTQPENSHYILLLGRACLKNGDVKKALKWYETAREKAPNSGEVLLYLADYYGEIGEENTAQQFLQEIIDNPKVEVGSKLLTLMHYLKSNAQDSTLLQTSFNKVLEQYPDEYDVRTQYLQWLLKNGKKELARTELRNVLDMNPNQLEVWKDYLSLYFEFGNNEKIREISQEALQYFPEESSFWYYIALTYAIEDRPDDALEAYQACITHTPAENKNFISKILGLIGDIYYTCGDTLQAFQKYDEALAQYGNNVLVLNNYAYFLCLTGKELEKAEKMSKRAIALEPDNSTYLDTYAWIFFKRGKYDMAKIYIERAFVHEEEGNAEITEHYGDILWFCGEKEAAHLEWIKAVNLSPKPSDILQRKADSGIYEE